MNVNSIGGALAAAAEPRAGGLMGKDQFLQLLVTQLRHQDPLNPADPKDFAAQLAQFSTLEQLINMGDQLNAMAASDAMMVELINSSSATSVLGKDILAVGDQFNHDPDNPEALTIGVGAGGGNGVLRIFDLDGNEVGSRELGWVNAGRQSITLGDELGDLPPGRYRYAVDMTRANGEAVPVQTFTAGHVSGIQYTAEGPMLMCGDIPVPLGNVIQVSVRK